MGPSVRGGVVNPSLDDVLRGVELETLDVAFRQGLVDFGIGNRSREA
jgi:hypothetical protein